MNTNIRPTSFLSRAALTLLLFFVCTLSARSASYIPCSVTLSTGTNSASCVGGSVSSNGTHVTVTPSVDFSVQSVYWEFTRDDETVAGWSLSEDDLSGDYIAGGAYGTVTVTFRTETENVQVTFEMSGCGGEIPATQNLTIGQKVTRPTDPTDENYDFVGWFCDAASTTPFDFDVALSYTTPYASYTNSNASASPYFNLVLYAKWGTYVEGYCGKKDDTHDGTQLTWSGYKCLPDNVIDDLTISGNGEMADDAFRRWNLNSVIINEGVTTIGQSAFYYCSGLTSVTIPSSVTTIGRGAFYDCSGLSSVTIYAPPLVTYGVGAFGRNASGRKIYVYSDFVNDYQAGWPDYKGAIEAIAEAEIFALPLADNADNATVIAGSDGRLANVTLQGRTLYKDGSWNTLCLPFALNATQTAEMLDNPEALMTLKSTSFEGGTLTLTFEAATAIEAGKPYIVKWSRANDYTDDNAHNLYAPTFPCVPISQATASIKTQYADFVGSYSPVSLAAGDGTVLYLGADNKLYYPSSAVTIGSCRAYFELKGDLTAGEPVSTEGQNIKSFVLNFGEESTGIEEVNGYGLWVNGYGAGWCTLDGRRLGSKPSSSGIYIFEGRKVLIK